MQDVQERDPTEEIDDFWEQPVLGEWSPAALLAVGTLGILVLLGLIACVVVCSGWVDPPNTPKTHYYNIP